ncbi:MAG: 3-oxoacyl-ACP synthase III, partial [Thermodesulfobacteriota bacterium]
MKFNNVSIVGLTHLDAPHRVTSEEIEDRIAPTLNRLKIRRHMLVGLSGIIARRFWDQETSFSDAATLAARKLLEKTGLDRDRLGIIISTSVCKDYIEPSMACLVHGNLGLPAGCINYDVGNACLAFCNAMEIIGGLIEQGQVEFGLIVDGEGSRYAVEKTIERILDPKADMQTYRDNYATLTLGSGAAAMILGRSDLVSEVHPLIGSICLADTRHNRLCLGQPDHMVTDPSALLTAGLGLAKTTWKLAEEELGWQGDCLDHYF